MIEVGLTKTLPSGKKSRYKYSDVEYDKEGWAKIEFYCPLKFDLVHGKTEEGTITSVWWTGKEWLGLRLKKSSKIMAWRRIPYECTAP